MKFYTELRQEHSRWMHGLNGLSSILCQSSKVLLVSISRACSPIDPWDLMFIKYKLLVDFAPSAETRHYRVNLIWPGPKVAKNLYHQGYQSGIMFVASWDQWSISDRNLDFFLSHLANCLDRSHPNGRFLKLASLSDKKLRKVEKHWIRNLPGRKSSHFHEQHQEFKPVILVCRLVWKHSEVSLLVC